VSVIRRGLRCAATALLLAGVAPAVDAQGTGTLPLDDLAYADVERLADLGMLDSVILGQRPYSRRELARIVRASRAALARSAREGTTDARVALARPPLGRLETRFAEDRLQEVSSRAENLVDRAGLSARSTDARRRGFSGSLTRELEATIDPLAVRRVGRPAPRGESAALELAHGFEPASWLSLQLRERLETTGPVELEAELLTGGVRARVGNVAVRLGREQVAWALATGDGLMLASDAPALDLVSISGDAPFVLPGPLRRLGLTQGTLLIAELGPSVARSRSKLLAYKISVLPHRHVELGATFLNHFGGEGGRSSTLGNRLIDFLPFVDIFRGHNYADTTRTLDVDSDKQLGVDGRVRLARLGGLVVSGELVIDDFDVHRIRTLFTWDGAQAVRLTMPTVANSPVSLSLTAKHTGVRTYTHGALSNGLTTRGRLLGDELGPDAKAFGVEAGWEPTGDVRASLGMRTAIYSRATYVTEEQGNHFLIRRVGDASNELRDRIIAALVAVRSERTAVTVRLAAERIRNADFGGGTRRDYAAEVALRYAR
jgi:hypothetical protein